MFYIKLCRITTRLVHRRKIIRSRRNRQTENGFYTALPTCFRLSLVGKSCLISTTSEARFIRRSQTGNYALADGMTRRTADYKPSDWDYSSLVHSLKVGYSVLDHEAIDVERMKGEIKGVLCDGEMRVSERLEFIDAVQRLGLLRHFDNEIKDALRLIHNDNDFSEFKDADLYITALMFRLLRQHGFHVRQDVFKKFTDDCGTFNELITGEAKALLTLYEASFYGLKGEDVMDEARDFACEGLKDYSLGIGVGVRPDDTITNMKVGHALEMPLHWRLNRFEARWFMEVYEKEPWANATLLALARLDFNMVQSVHRNELSDLARWWVELGLNKMNLSRDRLMELYLWCSSLVYEPQHVSCRQPITKIASMITLIDDVYDVYGTLEELQRLTDMVDRWDTHEIDRLPDAMKISLMALYDTTNQICDHVSEDKGIDIRPHVRKAWADQCRAYLQEATWYHKRLKPTMQQYLDRSITTVGVKIMLLFIYFLTTDDVTPESLDWLSQVPVIVHCTALICRLNNDLGTSSYELARGDNIKAVECYMNDAGVSEEVARTHVQNMVNEAWKTMNKEVPAIESKIPGFRHFLGVCMNFARASQSLDKYGDGHDAEKNSEIDRQVMLILVDPIQISNRVNNSSVSCLIGQQTRF